MKEITRARNERTADFFENEWSADAVKYYYKELALINEHFAEMGVDLKFKDGRDS